MICGYSNNQLEKNEIERFVAGCYPLITPPSSVQQVRLPGELTLGADGEGNLYRSGDDRYICAVHGSLYPTRPILESLSLEKDSAGPAELLLRYYQTAGLDRFNRLPGSFVFAIWDREERRLILGRDRFGGKRIYYSLTPGGLLFCSSLPGIVAFPGIDRRISQNGFIEYMTYGYVIPPNTIYDRISTLVPGGYLEYDGTAVSPGSFHPLAPDEWRVRDTSHFSQEELVDRVETMLTDSLLRRLPGGNGIGMYLSGGLDTPLLCALAKKQTDRKITAFTLASLDTACNEAPYARNIANYLRIHDHQNYYIQKDDFLDALFSLPKIYAQPFADISAIPTYTIAKNVSRQFDAVVGGDGPDFKYGGIDFRIWWRYYNRIPHMLRIPAAKILSVIFHTFFREMASPNIHISELLSQPEFFWIFHKKFKSFELERILGRAVDPSMFWIRNYLETRTDIPPYERFRHALFITFGTHGVFYKATAIHDALGLEFITPYYDPELFDFVQFLPTKYKFRDGRGKFLHKRLLFRHVPKRLFERPKRGFIINYNEFGLDLLRELTGTYLTRARLDETGLINTAYALECVERYYRGDLRMGPYLWTLLTFEIWRDAYAR